MNRTIDTRSYEASHWKLPRGRGWWIFENTTTGEQITVPDETYGTAVRSLPKGSWKVMP